MKKIVLGSLLSCLTALTQANFITGTMMSGIKFSVWSGIGFISPLVSSYFGSKIGKNITESLGIDRPRIKGFYADIALSACLGGAAAYCAKRVVHKGEWIPTMGLTAGFAGVPVALAVAHVAMRWWNGDTNSQQGVNLRAGSPNITLLADGSVAPLSYENAWDNPAQQTQTFSYNLMQEQNGWAMGQSLQHMPMESVPTVGANAWTDAGWLTNNQVGGASAQQATQDNDLFKLVDLRPELS